MAFLPVREFIQNIFYTIILCNVISILPIFLFAQENITLTVLQSEQQVTIQHIELIDDDHLMVAGTFRTDLKADRNLFNSRGQEDIFVGQLRRNGQWDWINTYGGSLEDVVSDMITDLSGNTWLLGTFRNDAVFADTLLQSVSGSDATYLIRLSANGAIDRLLVLDNGDLLRGTALSIDSKGHLYVAGHFSQTIDILGLQAQAASDIDIFWTKLDTAQPMEALYLEVRGNSRESRVIDLVCLEDDKIVLGGQFNGSIIFNDKVLNANTFDEDVFLAAFDENGDQKWALKAGGVFDQQLHRMTFSQNGTIYAAGNLVGVMSIDDSLRIESQNGNNDLYWIAIDSAGKPQQAFSFGGPAAEQMAGMVLQGEKLQLSCIYQDSWELDNQSIPASGTVSSAILELSITNNQLISQRVFNGQSAVFIRDTEPINKRYITAGAFSGELIVEMDTLDAGNRFWSWVAWPGNTTTSTQRYILPASEVVFFPNPITDLMTFSDTLIVEQLLVFDSQGKLQKVPAIKDNEINLSRLSPGVYFLSLIDVNGRVYSTQFVKQ